VTRNLFADMDGALKTASTHTHYYPENWKGRGWDPGVYKAFGKLFDSKVKLFVWELASLVLAPYILIAKLSKNAPAICEFCLVIKSRVPGAGDVCGFSTFDFDAFKDEAWEGRTLGKSVMPEGQQQPSGGETLAQSIMRTGNVEDATRQHPKPKAREGKMEKSFFNFQAVHPEWKCSPSGQSLVDRVEDYKKAELAAMSRERNLYIDAAARQLETLARLEEQPSPHPTRRFEEERLHDSHIPRVPPPADAGTGTPHTQGQAAAPAAPPPPTSTVPSLPSSPPSIPTLQSTKSRSSSLSRSPISGDNGGPNANQTLSSLMPPPSIPVNLAHSSIDLPASGGSSHLSSQSRGALRVGLSTELRRILDMSTLHASESVLQESNSPMNIPPVTDRTAERQVRFLSLGPPQTAHVCSSFASHVCVFDMLPSLVAWPFSIIGWNDFTSM
jgi:hypothetical protein